MKNSIDREDGILWVRPSGRFTGGDATEFVEMIAAATDDDDRAVILDCGRMTYIGSMGIRAVIMTAKRLMQQQTAFLLCAPSDTLRAAFHLSGIDRIVPIHQTRAEVLASLDR